MSAEKLRAAVALRSTAVNRVGEMLAFGQKGESGDAQQAALFEQYYPKLGQFCTDFDKNHTFIISCCDATKFDEEDAKRRDFDLMCLRVKSLHTKLYPVVPIADNSVAPVSEPRVHLPQIQLKTFSGNILEFPAYFDLFNAVIHENPRLSEIEKFNYLQSTLTGSGLQLVQTLPLTSNNYLIAYETLKHRYQNNRLVATAHWAAIDNVPKVASDNGVELRALLNTYSEHLSALRNLNFPVDSWDFPLVQMLLKKLDVHLIETFELQFSSTNIPKYQDLYNFLELRCVALEQVDLSKKLSEKLSISSEPYQPLKAASSFVVQSDESVETVKCAFCGSGHAIYRCQNFLDHSALERFRFVKRACLCLNCLCGSHVSRACSSQMRCKHCNQLHHTLLHFDPRPRSFASSKQSQYPSSSKQSQYPSSSKQLQHASSSNHPQPSSSSNKPQPSSSSNKPQLSKSRSQASLVSLEDFRL